VKALARVKLVEVIRQLSWLVFVTIRLVFLCEMFLSRSLLLRFYSPVIRLIPV
jgi:hypothetical protein